MLRVFRSALRYDFVNGTARRNRLEQLLQLSLRVDVGRLSLDLLELGRSLLQNKLTCRLQIAVEIDRADQGLECARRGGPALPAAARFSPATEHEKPAELERDGVSSQRAARDEPRTEFRQLTFR